MSDSDRNHRPPLVSGLIVLAVALSMSGCAELEEESGPPKYEPAALSPAEPVGVKKVTFTEDAARRVGLQTSTVSARGRYLIVDYAALIYDKTGLTWVYTVPEPLNYLRVKVAVERVAGQRVTLTRGPAAGTTVVTTGAAEVYGAELGIAGKG
jgi:hypothetical protein